MHSKSEDRRREGAPIIAQGRNCWRVVHANRLACLVDADAYFGAVTHAMSKAASSILILSWDIDTRTRVPLGRFRSNATSVAGFLSRRLREHEDLLVHVLSWRRPMWFAADREYFPRLKWRWFTHPRLHFKIDDCHPVGASHHQKVVVIDEHLAFCGGLDLTKQRWDTPAHRPDDPERRDFRNRRYRPFHDVQAIVDGKAATALGDLFRDRWRRCSGQELRARPASSECWPEGLRPDLTDVQVAIARTVPPTEREGGAFEIEQLHVDAISSARRSIYIENQYFTCERIARRLAERLTEPNGPEVVLVLPRNYAGVFERRVIGSERSRLLALLEQSDVHGRLRAVYPMLPGETAKTTLKMHAKLLIVDDRFMQIGSANLCNRSMRVDSECALAVELAADERRDGAAAGLRHRLLAEHLDATVEAVADVYEETGSLLAILDRLGTRPRHLAALDASVYARAKRPSELARRLIDPSTPRGAAELVPILRSRSWRLGAKLRALLPSARRRGIPR